MAYAASIGTTYDLEWYWMAVSRQYRLFEKSVHYDQMVHFSTNLTLRLD